ncbi:MAG: hypothetical protein IJE43_22380 [Alphaproteobacteria bacterium]|nr:hypothetical protein [Alphaproteobacteria bacterium]
MAYNNYISSLQSLRKDLENRIDNEIEECIRGRGDSEKLKSSLEYIVEQSQVLQGVYKDDETRK